MTREEIKPGVSVYRVNNYNPSEVLSTTIRSVGKVFATIDSPHLPGKTERVAIYHVMSTWHPSPLAAIAKSREWHVSTIAAAERTIVESRRAITTLDKLAKRGTP